MNPLNYGEAIYQFAERYFPIFRSLSGEGVRTSLKLIQTEIPSLRLVEVPSGTKCFDWEVPAEWSVTEAYLENSRGERVIDFKVNHLHVVGYSAPVDQTLSLAELQPHLFSLPQLPKAIPYVTSYYNSSWGFCLTHEQRAQLREDKYRAVIKSSLNPRGSLTYGEVLIPGRTEEEILLSTNICHPAMGNNETSGPAVTTFLAKHILAMKDRRYSYRLLFLPETIGAIVYLSRHWEAMKKNVVAGFQVVCVGDDRAISYLPSRLGNTLADRVAHYVLKREAPETRYYSFLDRGSDERQYCSPGIDLPVGSIMASKYCAYPEYHTSLDDLKFISPAGLGRLFDLHRRCLEILEANEVYRGTVRGEPQLGKRGLYPNISSTGSADSAMKLVNFLAYCDGKSDLIAISERIGVSVDELIPIVQKLRSHGLIEIAK